MYVTAARDNVVAFVKWARANHGMTLEATSPENARPGDVVAVDVHKNNQRQMGHLMLVTGRYRVGSHWEIRLAGHTHNRRDITWKNLIHISEVQRGWVLHLN